jgi:hypothetical protein
LKRRRNEKKFIARLLKHAFHVCVCVFVCFFSFLVSNNIQINWQERCLELQLELHRSRNQAGRVRDMLREKVSEFQCNVKRVRFRSKAVRKSKKPGNLEAFLVKNSFQIP